LKALSAASAGNRARVTSAAAKPARTDVSIEEASQLATGRLYECAGRHYQFNAGRCRGRG
jgi:hypothetical protein